MNKERIGLLSITVLFFILIFVWSIIFVIPAFLGMMIYIVTNGMDEFNINKNNIDYDTKI